MSLHGYRPSKSPGIRNVGTVDFAILPRKWWKTITLYRCAFCAAITDAPERHAEFHVLGGPRTNQFSYYANGGRHVENIEVDGDLQTFSG